MGNNIKYQTKYLIKFKPHSMNLSVYLLLKCRSPLSQNNSVKQKYNLWPSKYPKLKSKSAKFLKSRQMKIISLNEILISSPDPTRKPHPVLPPLSDYSSDLYFSLPIFLSISTCPFLYSSLPSFEPKTQTLFWFQKRPRVNYHQSIRFS